MATARPADGAVRPEEEAMFRHVVMFRWREDADPTAIAAACGALGELASAVPEVRSLSFGADAGVREGNYDMVVVVDFADIDGYRTYADHPAHLALIADHLRPLIDDRAAVQYEPAQG
jgi:hypothetical protein